MTSEKKNNELSTSVPISNLDNFEALFKQYYAPLVVYACTIDTSLKSYLYRSVYNACMNYINQRSIQEKHIRNIDLERNDEENLENEINSVELQNRIFNLIESLPPKCRKIFKMNRLEGMKNEEIAVSLHLSKRTVETQISKALKILRNKLSDYNLNSDTNQASI
jgi:RNA polymerase sigma factor (sigma-70 family)